MIKTISLTLHVCKAHCCINFVLFCLDTFCKIVSKTFTIFSIPQLVFFLTSRFSLREKYIFYLVFFQRFFLYLTLVQVYCQDAWVFFKYIDDEMVLAATRRLRSGPPFSENNLTAKKREKQRQNVLKFQFFANIFTCAIGYILRNNLH